MGEDVAPFVEAAFFCRDDEAAILALPALYGEAGNFQVALGNFGGGCGGELTCGGSQA